MGSHGAVGKGGGGKEKGKPGIADPGAPAAVAVSVVDEVDWLVPGGNTHSFDEAPPTHKKTKQSLQYFCECAGSAVMGLKYIFS